MTTDNMNYANVSDKIANLEKERDEYKRAFEAYERGFIEYQKNPEYQNLHSQIYARDLAIELLQKENAEMKAHLESAKRVALSETPLIEAGLKAEESEPSKSVTDAS